MIIWSSSYLAQDVISCAVRGFLDKSQPLILAGILKKFLSQVSFKAVSHTRNSNLYWDRYYGSPTLTHMSQGTFQPFYEYVSFLGFYFNEVTLLNVFGIALVFNVLLIFFSSHNIDEICSRNVVMWNAIVEDRI